MKPDLILSNPPYGKIGVDITKHLMANHNDSQMAILGTKGMFKKHYDCIALEYVQVGEYQYDPKGGKTRRLDWGVCQAILLAWHHKGHTWTEVIPRETIYGGGCIRPSSKRASSIDIKYAMSGGPISCFSIGMLYNTPNVAGSIDFSHVITNLVCTVGLPVSDQSKRGFCSCRTLRVCTEQELPQIEHVKWVKEVDPNYIWKVFESLEDAVNAAVYLGSWTTPSDSHNRLKELGFIDTLIAHEE